MEVEQRQRTLGVYRLVHRGVILLQPFFAFGDRATEFAVLDERETHGKRGFLPSQFNFLEGRGLVDLGTIRTSGGRWQTTFGRACQLALFRTYYILLLAGEIVVDGGAVTDLRSRRRVWPAAPGRLRWLRRASLMYVGR